MKKEDVKIGDVLVIRYKVIKINEDHLICELIGGKSKIRRTVKIEDIKDERKKKD